MAKMRTLEPHVSLAISVQSNPGVYALLLGSGVSRKAGIPTGWEVTLDLVTRIAQAQGKLSDCQLDPAKWYQDTYQEEPNYSKVLDIVAKSPTERSRLLRGYFEPSEPERTEGLKAPTKAHASIAELVARNFVRVILTTNFDRLMEQALDARGITPTVVSTADGVEGAEPLIHTRCTIIKIHGDYLDTRIKNTPEELSAYDRRMDRLLDQVFDEFGLIISGWSTEWDIALASAIERCPNRRYTSYWSGLSPIRGQAQRLASLRRAEFIQVTGADEFFSKLTEQVISLDEMQSSNPLSAKIAEATAKRYIVDEKSRIRLHEMVHEETERAFASIASISHLGPLPDEANGWPHFFRTRSQKFRSHIDVIRAILTTGAAWGGDDQDDIWLQSLSRISRVPGPTSGYVDVQNFYLYPTMILVYSMGVSALARGRLKFLCKLLRTTTKSSRSGQSVQISLLSMPRAVMNFSQASEAFEKRSRSPISDHIYSYLLPHLSSLLPDESDYEESFNRFEYLLSLTSLDARRFRQDVYIHYGRFGNRSYFMNNEFLARMLQEIEAQKNDWPFLHAAHFDSKWSTVVELHNQLADFAIRFNHSQGAS